MNFDNYIKDAVTAVCFMVEVELKKFILIEFKEETFFFRILSPKKMMKNLE
jgi:hypothetical protein